MLADWAALSLAVQNSWGGPDSSEKRDWFAGAVSELMESTPDADAHYLEEFLMQVMNHEFEVNVEDASGEEIAERILRLKMKINTGDFHILDQMLADWEQTKGKGKGTATIAQGKSENQEVDSEDEDSQISEDEDETMGEAPPLVNVKQKVEPEVDDDGFTKVVRNKYR